MSHMINLYKLENGQIVEIEMLKIQQALSKLTSEDWSDYEGGDVSVEFKELEPIQIAKPKPTGLKNIFSRKGKTPTLVTEANEQEIDADEHSIAFNRPQKGFEFAMFDLMSELKLIAIRDESFSETEAILSLNELKRSEVPHEIDSMPTKNMDLLLVQDASDLLSELYT